MLWSGQNILIEEKIPNSLGDSFHMMCIFKTNIPGPSAEDPNKIGSTCWFFFYHNLGNDFFFVLNIWRLDNILLSLE